MLLLTILACTEPILYPDVPAGADTAPPAPITDTSGGDIPCSPQDATPAVDVLFSNGHDALIEISWLDGDCVEYTYYTLLPGDQVTQPSYAEHVWVARDGQGAYLDHYVTAADQPSWTVSP